MLIDFEEIGNTASTCSTLLDELKEKQKKILNDILKLNESYQGEDANLLISNYTKNVNSMNVLIDTLDKYDNYFKMLAGDYKDGYFKSKNKIENNDIIDDLEKNNLANLTISEDITNNIENGDVDGLSN